LAIASNAEIVGQILDHWGRLEAIPPELLAEDVQFVNAEDAIEPGIRRGQSGFAEAGSNFRRAYSALQIEVEREVRAADRVGLIVDMHLTGRGSGIDFHERMGWLFTIRDGQLARFEWSRDPEALIAPLSA
jgi:ketosteroid isomerase-like protein